MMQQTLVKVKQETEADQLKQAFASVMIEIAQQIPPQTLEDIQICSRAIPHLNIAIKEGLIDENLFDSSPAWGSFGSGMLHVIQSNKLKFYFTVYLMPTPDD
jgi:hypothetical protein